MDQELKLIEMASELTTIKLLSGVLILVVLALTVTAYSIAKGSSGDTKVILELSSLIGRMVKSLDTLNGVLRDHSVILTEIKGLLDLNKQTNREKENIDGR